MSKVRLIDADALENEVCHGCQYEHNKYANCIDCAIANAPTVDAVQVVRCKDCKHCIRSDSPIGWCEGNTIFVPDDWFCADGERREE